MEVIHYGNQWLLALTLTVPRFLVLFIMLPFFGSSFIPTSVRNGLAIALSFIALPTVFYQIKDIPFNGVQFLGMIFKEAILGAVMGYLVSIVFWAVSTAGNVVDTQRGAMSAQMFNPIVAGQTSPLGLFFTQTAVTLFLTTGGFLALLTMVYQTYISWPVTTYFPELELESTVLFLGQFDKLLYMALQIAAPAMILMFLTDLGLGLIGRFVPSINVFLLAMPLKSVLSFLVIAIYMSTIMYFLSHHFSSYDYLQVILENAF
jgi:type III secretion protein T